MKTITCFSALCIVLLSGLFLSVQAQTSFNISNKTTGDTLLTIDNSGRMGLGITVPGAGFHMLHNDGALFSGTITVGTIPVEGAGTRMMWYPAKAAFRVGRVNGTQWDDFNIGEYSIALGRRTTASGAFAQTYGNFSTASGDHSMALGRGATASGNTAIAIGRSIEASGNFSFAIGVGEQGGTVVSQDTTLAIIGGRIGIHTVAPSSAFEVADTIHSSFGGFKFPDGSLQQTAAGSGTSNGNTLDQAYDQGGSGNGRVIVADSGAFEVNGVDGVLFTGTVNLGVIPTEAAGTRMMWYPGRAAFRAGRVTGALYWDADSIGSYSFATGLDTRASGHNSTAMGYRTEASANYSVAMGYRTTASANYSTAMGYDSRALGPMSTAIGYDTEASGHSSFALGLRTIASGRRSVALGESTIASGELSTAIGEGIEAQGSHSVAIALSDQTGQQIIRDSVMAIMGGKVGIGTVDPSAKLEIKGEIDEYPLVLTSNNAPFNSTPFLLFQRPGNYELLSISSDDPSNLFLGLNTGINNAPSGDYGVNNVFIGLYSGYLNTSGNYNTAVGTASLVSNSTGAGNTAIGTEALTLNTTGFNNTAIGVAALRNNSTGDMNSALGGRALRRNTTGQGNVGIGWEANYYNEEGSNNTLIGHRAGGVQVTHNKNGNVFVGYEAGYNETGNNNLYIENSRSSTPLIYGQFDNDFISVNGGLAATDTFGLGIIPLEGAGSRLMWYPGKAAFRSGRVSGSQWDDSDIGDYSTAMGYNTVASGGEGTVAMGYNSVARGNGSLVAGFSNIVNGSYSVAAGRFCTTDQAHSTAWGSHAKAHHTASMVFAANSSSVLSDSVYSGGAEQMVFRADGGTYFTNSGGAAPYNTSRLINTSTGAYLSSGGTWTNSSSRDFKENISDLPLSAAIEAVKQLNPVTYNYKAEQDENYVGFIAEDVPELAATKDRKGLSPMDIVAVLTKVVQDQQARIERLEQEINKMEKSR